VCMCERESVCVYVSVCMRRCRCVWKVALAWRSWLMESPSESAWWMRNTSCFVCGCGCVLALGEGGCGLFDVKGDVSIYNIT
jgi:hypothetical protein